MKEAKQRVLSPQQRRSQSYWNGRLTAHSASAAPLSNETLEKLNKS